MKKHCFKILIVFALAYLLCGCDLLVKDLPKNGISYTPLSYEVENIDYITDVNSDEILWTISPNVAGDTKLTIYSGLTNAKSIEVSDVLINEKQITVRLKASKIKTFSVIRPKINLSVYGLNPFLKNEYEVKLIENYPTYKLDMTLSDALNFIAKETNSLDTIPVSTKLIDARGELVWQMDFYSVNPDNPSPVNFVSVKLNTKTKELKTKKIKSVSNKIKQGSIVDFIDEDHLLTNSDAGLSSYYIPENKDLKINGTLTDIKLSAIDTKGKAIYLYSDEHPNSYFKIDETLELTKKPTYLDEEVKQLSAYNNKLLILTKENIIYLVTPRKKKIFSSPQEIESIDFAGELLFEIKKDKPHIFKKSSNRDVFIDYGTHPIFSDSNIVYKLYDQTDGQYLYSYDLFSSLKNKFYAGNHMSYKKNADDSLLILESKNNSTKLFCYSNGSINYLCDIPNLEKSNAFYSKKHHKVFMNYQGSIYEIDLT